MSGSHAPEYHLPALSIASRKILRPAASGLSMRATTSGPMALAKQSSFWILAMMSSALSTCRRELPCSKACATAFSAQGSHPAAITVAMRITSSKFPSGTAAGTSLSPVAFTEASVRAQPHWVFPAPSWTSINAVPSLLSTFVSPFRVETDSTFTAKDDECEEKDTRARAERSSALQRAVLALVMPTHERHFARGLQRLRSSA